MNWEGEKNTDGVTLDMLEAARMNDNGCAGCAS